MSPKRRRRRPRREDPSPVAETTSPAQRYADFRRRQREESATLREFLDTLTYIPDDYQREAMEIVDRGEGVLVAAPTGAGKTVVAEYALARAHAGGLRAFYTTPIKALSNQKFRDFSARFGTDNVGLTTGDVTINPHAPIVVMTTEVLRNMVYRDDTRLNDLGCVVMDEVHYLADRFRGPAWEEVIIHLPSHVQLVSLSATVSNAEEFAAWLDEVRSNTRVIVSETRPVPLVQHLCVAGRIYPLFAENSTARLNRSLICAIEAGRAPGRRRMGGPRQRIRRTSHGELVAALRKDRMLPAIVFIFSRAGCDSAVSHLLASGQLLTNEDEARRIGDHIRQATSALDPAARRVLRIGAFQAAAEAGIAAHHAGMLPLMKEIVEDLFAQGLLKVVFATETLSLGINMPAKTVVLDSLEKWNGRERVRLTPGQYTQLTGRAGRRSLDTVGHAVVCYTPAADPELVAALASKRSYPLISAFHPTYNMAANLLARLSVEDSRSLMERSFAQFQADRQVVGKAQEAARLRAQRDEAARRMHCDRGDFVEYATLKASLRAAERARPSPSEREQARNLCQAAQLGDVIGYVDEGRPTLGIVVSTPPPHAADVLEVLTTSASLRQVGPRNAPLSHVGRMTFEGLEPRRPRDRQRLASRLRRACRDWGWQAPTLGVADVARLREQLRSHPCHRCPDRTIHQAKASRYWRLERRLKRTLATIDRTTSSIGATFERVREVLTRLGYLDADDTPTPAGELLARIYAEHDLLIAECVRTQIWEGLDAATLSGAISACLYVPRSDQSGESLRALRAPGPLFHALREIERAKARIAAIEAEAKAPRSSEPDAGMARSVSRWAMGAGLDDVLNEVEGLTPGDFVRHIKQVIDVARQLRTYCPTLAETAEETISALRRDVVSWSESL